MLLDEAYALFPRLGERRNQAAGTLSGGEQRMLSLARVMVERPRLLIADELSLGLAPIVVDETYRTLEQIRDAGTTLLIVEQHVHHALAIADDVRQELLRVKDVSKVELFGTQDEKIFIEIAQKKWAQLGLDLNAVLTQLGQQNAIESAGTLETANDVMQIRIEGPLEAVSALAAMPIRGASGQQLRLGDIAQIRRGYVDPPQVKVRHQGRQVVALGVSMTKGGDIIELGKALRQAVAKQQSQLPAGVSLRNLQDQPQAVSRSVGEFIGVLIEAVVIVLLVSFISLGLHKGGRWGWYVDMRPGWVVAITIPLVLAMTFLAMYYWGIGLHKISLGSLIISLGLLVDDAIIAVEMMVRKLEEGYDKVRAATFAYEVTAMPMLTGTLITAAGFLPIGLAKSVTGEYTFAIFAVTVIALLLSWWVSVFFVPLLGTWLLKVKPHLASSQPQELFDTPFYNTFRRHTTIGYISPVEFERKVGWA